MNYVLECTNLTHRLTTSLACLSDRVHCWFRLSRKDLDPWYVGSTEIRGNWNQNQSCDQQLENKSKIFQISHFLQQRRNIERNIPISTVKIKRQNDDIISTTTPLFSIPDCHRQRNWSLIGFIAFTMTIGQFAGFNKASAHFIEWQLLFNKVWFNVKMLH